MVKQFKSFKRHLHSSALINNTIHLLAFLVRIHIDHQMATCSSGCFPVNTAYIISSNIPTYLFKFKTMTRFPNLFKSNISRISYMSFKFKLPEQLEGRKDF